MKTSVAIGAVLLALPAAAMSPPPDTAPGAERVFLQCEVSPQQTSRNCVFYSAIENPTERLKAANELVFLDAHPMPIVGARPGSKVKVLVRLMLSAAAGGFTVAAPASPAPAPGPAIRDPVWIDSPAAAWSRAFADNLAMRRDRSGEAVVTCLAGADGTLGDCWVNSEEPADLGFGEAALIIMQHARMRTTDATGAAVAGRVVVYRLRAEREMRNGAPVWPGTGGPSGMAMGMMSPH